MDDSEVLEKLIALAEDNEPDALLETSAATLHADLYDRAVDRFGSWDAVLAAALCRAASTGTRGRSGADRTERIVRSPGPDAEHPIFAATENNVIFKIVPGTELPLTAEPQHLDTPAGSGPVTHFHHVGDPDGLVFFSNTGNYFALDPRMVPKWKGSEEIRRLDNILEISAGERLEFVLPRRAFYGGRIIHVTAGGKGKATDASDFDYALDHEARTAFGLNDGDRPIAVLAVPGGTGIFCASAHGRGIHFPDTEVRSMGNRAVGVNVMDVSGEDDEIVGAFTGHRVEHVAVITRDGLGKRVEFDEFRQQGRAGAGMQLARLNKDDQIAGVAPCHPSDDIVLSTSRGRVQRRPAGDFDLMGRPAKGNRVVDFADDEKLVEFARLPCSSD